MATDQDGNRHIIGRAEAARVLQKLHICKAFGPKGAINGPNCQHFGHRDESGHWSWDVAELIDLARKKGSATEEEIQDAARPYGLATTPASPEPRKEPQVAGRSTLGRIVANTVEHLTSTVPKEAKPSRAELVHQFVNLVRELESAMKKLAPQEQRNRSERTLGKLISELQTLEVLNKRESAEARFVTQVRNVLVHADSGDVSDEQLTRAVASARGLLAILKPKSHS